jgi:hypothetical protein
LAGAPSSPTKRRGRPESGRPRPAGWPRIVLFSDDGRSDVGVEAGAVGVVFVRKPASASRAAAKMLAEVAPSPQEGSLTFVCGPTPLVESVATALVGLGHDAGRIKTERFGPPGG